METKTKTIARVNNVSIIAGNDENEMVPIKPICEVLGIQHHGQIEKIKSHPILNSVVQTVCTTGSDGKQYNMVCLPLEFVFGWLFTINPENVKDEAKETVIQYQYECYRALYAHFTSFANFNKEKQERLKVAFEEYRATKQEFNQARQKMAESERTMVVVKDLTYEQWLNANRQKTLDFTETEQV